MPPEGVCNQRAPWDSVDLSCVIGAASSCATGTWSDNSGSSRKNEGSRSEMVPVRQHARVTGPSWLLESPSVREAPMALAMHCREPADAVAVIDGHGGEGVDGRRLVTGLRSARPGPRPASRVGVCAARGALGGKPTGTPRRIRSVRLGMGSRSWACRRSGSSAGSPVSGTQRDRPFKFVQTPAARRRRHVVALNAIA